MLRHSLATFEVDKTSFSGIYNLRNIDAPSFREKPVIGQNKASFRRTDTKLFFRKNYLNTEYTFMTILFRLIITKHFFRSLNLLKLQMSMAVVEWPVNIGREKIISC